MKRAAWSTLIATLFALSLFGGGCGASGSSPSTPNDAPTPSAPTRMIITANGTSLAVDLEDNETARALAAMLAEGDITIEMSDYGNMEKVGPLPRALPRNDSQITASAGDVMLYQGDKIVIFYGANSYSYTRIGKISGATRESVLAALGGGDVRVSLSLKRSESAKITLNDGRKMPIFGYGTWTISDAQVEDLVHHAIKSGYRLIDTAQYYGNEAGVGRGVRRAIDDGIVSREDVFVTTKIAPWGSGGYDEGIDASNSRLGLGYIDLMLIHQRGAGEIEMYRAMERAVARGVVRSIGISNYYTPEAVREVTAGASIMPAVIQNENHPFYQNAPLRAYAKEIGAVIESYYPLGGRGHTKDVLGDPTIARIAAARGKTAAQIVLRWHIQSGSIAIPGSSSKAHIDENLGANDFSLTDAEMAEIAAMDTGRRYESW